MTNEAFSKLSNQSVNIQRRCQTLARRPKFKLEGIGAESIWEKAQQVAEVLQCSDPEEGLIFLEESPDLPPTQKE